MRERRREEVAADLEEELADAQASPRRVLGRLSRGIVSDVDWRVAVDARESLLRPVPLVLIGIPFLAVLSVVANLWRYEQGALGVVSTSAYILMFVVGLAIAGTALTAHLRSSRKDDSDA